jgi:hypothetical protein
MDQRGEKSSPRVATQPDFGSSKGDREGERERQGERERHVGVRGHIWVSEVHARLGGALGP